MTRIVPTLALLGLVVASLASPATAAPSTSLDVERRGACSGTSRWELDLESGTRIHVDFEINTRSAGDTWHVVLRHDGDVIFRGTRTTDHEGDLDVERRAGDHSGIDRFRASATLRSTGESCVGAARI